MSKGIITMVIVMIILFLISILFDQIPKWLKERKMSKALKIGGRGSEK